MISEIQYFALYSFNTTFILQIPILYYDLWWRENFFLWVFKNARVMGDRHWNS